MKSSVAGFAELETRQGLAFPGLLLPVLLRKVAFAKFLKKDGFCETRPDDSLRRFFRNSFVREKWRSAKLPAGRKSSLESETLETALGVA